MRTRTCSLRNLAWDHTAALSALVCTTIAATVAAPVGAQESVTVNQYGAAETVDDGFGISRPDDHGHLRFGANLHLDYANDPLVYEAMQGESDSEIASVIEHQFNLTAMLSFGLWDRLVVYAGAPIVLVMDGEDEAVALGQPDADGAGLGDLLLGARVRLLGERDDVFAMALQLTGTAPTASGDQRFSGDDSFGFRPELILEARPGGVAITLDLGARIRDEAELARVNVGQELTYGLGLAIPLYKGDHVSLGGHLELYGATSFEDFGGREESPMEALAGLKLGTAGGWRLGVAGGPGLQRGYGTPDGRFVATLGWAMPEAEPLAAEPAPGPVDTDGDGIFDDDDQCPRDPEDRDGFEDADGCPDPDNDMDGILDENDRCPNQPEDADGFEDEDGCPDRDNDADGLVDEDDRCPTEPEDADGFEDADGCPDPDNDGDGVPDTDDDCPRTPGKPEDNGCPKTVRVDEESGQIRILERIEFATNRARIQKSSEAVLSDVATTIASSPDIRRVRVEGHTDDRGADGYNMELSRKRARAVMEWLTGHDIAADRLEAWGCGEVTPIESNDAAEGRQANRRVEFHIIDPAPKGGVRNPEGCVQIE